MKKFSKPPVYPTVDDPWIEALRESYPLEAEEAFELLRFLVVFSIGAQRLKVEPNCYDRRLLLFTLDMHVMGYSHEKIHQLVRGACAYIRFE